MSGTADILEQFEANRQSVRALMHFDREVLDVAITSLKRLNTKWKSHLLRDTPTDASNKPATPNPALTADALITMLSNIRGHDSLRTNYDLILNQCIVLLVSFFGSAAHSLCISLMARALRDGRNEALLDLSLKLTVRDLQGAEADWEETIAQSIVSSSATSFQDMKSIGRAYRDFCGWDPTVDENVNNVITAQACRHAIVHTGARVDARLVRQVQEAHPRALKPTLRAGSVLQFSEDEVEIVGESMSSYLAHVAENAL